MNQIERTIIALDQMSLEEIDALLKLTKGQITHVKIGLELFLKFGPAMVKKIHDTHKVSIFLDLKLHDIPTTVKMAIRSLKDLPIEFLTIHLGGGEAMLTAAQEEALESLPLTKLLGVSFLTCLSEEDLLNIYGIEDMTKAFSRLFHLASITGIHGVICSPYEVELVKNNHANLLAMTPGIRFTDESPGDQKRIASPKEAFNMGADFIIMGRSITKSKNLDQRLRELQVPISVF